MQYLRLVAILAALCGQGAAAQEARPLDLDILQLGTLAQTDAAAALAEVDGVLARLQVQGLDDPRVVHDLYALRADLLERTGQNAAAAALLVELAGFVAPRRDVLDIDPAPLLRRAAQLFETAGNVAAALEATDALLAEQRGGARSPGVLSDTLLEAARLAERAGRADLAAAYADQAAASERIAEALPEAAPADSATRSADEVGFRAVDVYYATDRARSGDLRPEAFYGAGRGQLELGIATVTIPDIHVPGMVEAPSIWRLEFAPDPVRHVVLQSVTPVDKDTFYGALQAEFDRAPAREAFVFVHGYNVRFDQAARRAAQIAYDMSYQGVPILYSWPSSGSTVGYIADTAVVRLSGRRLSRFLEELVARSGARTVHLVAHSMGNRALTDALELMALRRGAGPDSAPVFGQVLFAAPDVDADLFREMLPTIRPLARRLTLYASQEDWALVTSRKLHGNAPRAGQGGADTLAAREIDSVDMSELGQDMLAHSYFADDSSALADMMALFWQNAGPERRCGLVSDTEDAGAGAADAVPVWRYRSGQCENRPLVELIAHFQAENIHSADAARAVIDRVLPDRAMAARIAPVVLKMLGD